MEGKKSLRGLIDTQTILRNKKVICLSIWKREQTKWPCVSLHSQLPIVDFISTPLLSATIRANQKQSSRKMNTICNCTSQSLLFWYRKKNKTQRTREAGNNAPTEHLTVWRTMLQRSWTSVQWGKKNSPVLLVFLKEHKGENCLLENNNENGSKAMSWIWAKIVCCWCAVGGMWAWCYQASLSCHLFIGALMGRCGKAVGAVYSPCFRMT